METMENEKEEFMNLIDAAISHCEKESKAAVCGQYGVFVSGEISGLLKAKKIFSFCQGLKKNGKY